MVKSNLRKFGSKCSFLSLFILLVIVGCRSHKPVEVEKRGSVQKVPHDQPMITVFVPGTRLLPKIAVQEWFFTANGLNKISELDASYKTMHMIVSELSRLDPQRFSYERFYAFGWEGELDFDKRREAARELYVVLNRLVDEYEKKHGVRAGLTLITHSHGGNVVLNLAAVKDKNNSLKIDLILLACPVQEETKHLIDDPMFTKKYALCSSGDFLQVIDPQRSPDHFFSGRWFPPYKGVVQAKIKKNGRAIMHIEFLMQHFIKRLPEILDVMDVWYETAKSTNNGIQKLPFPLIDLRAKSIRIGGRRPMRAGQSHQICLL